MNSWVGSGTSKAILIATGSDLSLSIEAYEKLLAEGIRSRAVFVPSWDLFNTRPRSTGTSVLPPDVKARVVVKQASTLGWERYVAESNRVIGMHAGLNRSGWQRRPRNS